MGLELTCLVLVAVMNALGQKELGGGLILVPYSR